MSKENSNDTIGNQIRNIPACSIVPTIHEWNFILHAVFSGSISSIPFFLFLENTAYNFSIFLSTEGITGQHTEPRIICINLHFSEFIQLIRGNMPCSDWLSTNDQRGRGTEEGIRQWRKQRGSWHDGRDEPLCCFLCSNTIFFHFAANVSFKYML
jgi:hypothetical protein